MRREVKVGGQYRHFKGHLITVLNVAEHTETKEKLVIYEHNETGHIWARPYDMFQSEVDHEKYPNIDQKYRFEEIEV